MSTKTSSAFVEIAWAATFLLVAVPTPASAQVTSRVSIATSGGEGNGSSFLPSISSDGRHVAFQSEASNLVTGDTGGIQDIFVHDRSSATTERVSVDSNGMQGNARSNSPSISADGRFVAFYSEASNLVTGDTNGVRDIFVHDRASGTTERVSVATGGAQADGPSLFPSISADGRLVAFHSDASNLVVGDTNGWRDIFVHDRQTDSTERVSVDSAGGQANSYSDSASIAASGRYVAFVSGASNLVAGDTNGNADIFVHDRQSGVTERIAGGDGSSRGPSISLDGRFVAFWSSATDLVAGDTNGLGDVFLRDRQNGAIERLSVDSAGVQADGRSDWCAISADGRHVAFQSDATNLVFDDTNGFKDVFVRDWQPGVTERVSIAIDGTQGDGDGYTPSISADGRYVSFLSLATNIVANDANGVGDIFVRDQQGVTATKYCPASSNSTGSPADIAAHGSASVTDGYLELRSAPVPNQPGIFFHGQNQTQVVFGNGFLCAASGIVRGVVTLPVSSMARYAYDNSDAKHSLLAYVGTTRNFQHWFRDPMAGGALFNLSNAISIAILP